MRALYKWYPFHAFTSDPDLANFAEAQTKKMGYTERMYVFVSFMYAFIFLCVRNIHIRPQF